MNPFKILAKYYNNNTITLHRITETGIENFDKETETFLYHVEEKKVLENFNDRFIIQDILPNGKDIPYYRLYSPKLNGLIVVSAEEMLNIMKKAKIEEGKFKTSLYVVPEVDKYGYPTDEYNFLTKKEFIKFLKRINKEHEKELKLKELIKNNKQKFSALIKNDVAKKTNLELKYFNFYASKEGDILLYLDNINENEYLTVNLNNLLLGEGYKYENINKVLEKFAERLNEITDFSLEHQDKLDKKISKNISKIALVVLFEYFLSEMIKNKEEVVHFQIVDELITTDTLEKISLDFQNGIGLYNNPISGNKLEEPYFYLFSDAEEHLSKIIEPIKGKVKFGTLDDYIDYVLIHKNFAKRQKEVLEQNNNLSISLNS